MRNPGEKIMVKGELILKLLLFPCILNMHNEERLFIAGFWY